LVEHIAKEEWERPVLWHVFRISFAQDALAASATPEAMLVLNEFVLRDSTAPAIISPRSVGPGDVWTAYRHFKSF
jgi:hypothetical protein